MNDFIEQLESRTLMSTSYPAAGTYNGSATPVGQASQAAIIAAVGSKKGGGKLAASLVLAIAANDIVTGSLTLTYNKTTTVGSYVLSGLVVGVDVSVTIESTGSAVGTFDGELKALDKKLTGPFTDTLNGKAITGNLNLINQASVKTTTGGGGKKNIRTNPGVNTNQTPPITNGNSSGDQSGITGGDNSGTGVISDGGSLLG